MPLPLIRVLLAEDHPQMREAIVSVLRKTCEVAGTVEHGDAVLAAAQHLQPEAVVLDISMPGRSGLQLLPELRSKLPNSALLILTSHDSEAYRDEAARRGADGYILKNTAAVALWPALLTAVSDRQSLRASRAASL